MAKKNGAPTKSDIVAQIAEVAELSRKQVAAVFESLNGIIKKSLRGPGCSRSRPAEDEGRRSPPRGRVKASIPSPRKR